MDAALNPPALTEQTRRLLYNLALLEYNNLYWRSHPTVRRLAQYKHAADATGNR